MRTYLRPSSTTLGIFAMITSRNYPASMSLLATGAPVTKSLKTFWSLQILKSLKTFCCPLSGRGSQPEKNLRPKLVSSTNILNRAWKSMDQPSWTSKHLKNSAPKTLQNMSATSPQRRHQDHRSTLLLVGLRELLLIGLREKNEKVCHERIALFQNTWETRPLFVEMSFNLLMSMNDKLFFLFHRYGPPLWEGVHLCFWWR